jgi:hypothetical protein
MQREQMKFRPGHYLTKEQQMVICVVLLLLLTGLAVKVWRTGHPPTTFPQKAAVTTPA